MKIAIHHNPLSFSDEWIEYCNSNHIDYKLVNCYDTDIVQQLIDCDALMWHFYHDNSKDFLFAKQLIYALESSGKIVFPDFNTAWHFDDKLGQKYLLEALDIPSPPAYVFYDKKEALYWAERAIFPKVFKLRRGAGSENVKLVRDKKTARKLICKGFRKGFSQYNAWGNLKERFRKLRKGKTNLWDLIKGIIRLGYPTKFAQIAGNEIGYAYFQDFIPNNNYDIRVIVINEKAFAIKRLVRENDFRASGSGMIKYGEENFDSETIKLSFIIAEKLRSQCLALDYVYNNGNPLVVEISYGYDKKGYLACVGYWDKDLIWHEGKFDSQGWMIDTIVKNIKNGKKLALTPFLYIICAYFI